MSFVDGGAAGSLDRGAKRDEAVVNGRDATVDRGRSVRRVLVRDCIV